MHIKLLSSGVLQILQPDGQILEIGPEHPDYRRHYASYSASYQAGIKPWSTLQRGFFACGAMVAGLAVSAFAHWWNRRTLDTEHYYSIKLVFLEPSGVALALFIFYEVIDRMVDWNRLFKTKTQTKFAKLRQIVLWGTVVLWIVAIGFNFYWFEHYVS